MTMTTVILIPLLLLINVTSSISIQQALVEDLMPPSSDLCATVANTTDGNTFVNEVFYSTQNISQWDAKSLPFEKDAFLLEFGHNNTNNINQSWTLRVSHGGGVYSYIGAYGEAIPPQNHEKAPWIDEVWQNVAVDGSLNDFNTNNLYYIHQAGTYQRTNELLTKPFYSPNLIKYCNYNSINGQCSFISWGQQAHIPTSFNSSLLYYTRYKDCGNGILEITTIFHNFGLSKHDTYNYLNVPWGGVRTSVFNDWLIANKNGNGSHLIYPQPSFSDTSNGNLPWIEDTGGYFIFTQDLPLPHGFITYTLPCGDGTGNVVDCNTINSTQLNIIISQNNPCRYSSGHTNDWGLYTIYCKIQTTVLIQSGCQGCTLEFINNRNNKSFHVFGVMHWSWNSNTLYLWPIESMNYTVDYINNILQQNDILTVKYSDFGMSEEDNLALTFVFGKDKYRGDWTTPPHKSRLRHGLAGRDFTVFTRNVFPKISSGNSYINRQFIITDRYINIDPIAKIFVDETYQNFTNIGDIKGRNINIFVDFNNKQFTVLIYNNCSVGNWLNNCIGCTTPQNGNYPLFVIKCGNESHVAFDPYVLSPINNTRKPWICNGMDINVRPKWNFLGFFPYECDITAMEEYVYVENDIFCTVNPTPTPTSNPITVSPTTTGPTTINPTIYETDVITPNESYVNESEKNTVNNGTKMYVVLLLCIGVVIFICIVIGVIIYWKVYKHPTQKLTQEKKINDIVVGVEIYETNKTEKKREEQEEGDIKNTTVDDDPEIESPQTPLMMSNPWTDNAVVNTIKI
eukprot:305934_1